MGAYLTIMALGALSVAMAMGQEEQQKLIDKQTKVKAQELFDNFVVSSKQRPPQTGESFPNLQFRTVSGKTLSTRGELQLILIRTGASTSSKTLFEQSGSLIKQAKVQVKNFVTTGDLPQTYMGELVDLRDPSSPHEYSTGVFQKYIGLVQTPGAYLLDKTGKVLAYDTSSRFVESIPAALKSLIKGQPIRDVNTKMLDPGKPVIYTKHFPQNLKTQIQALKNKSMAIILSDSSCTSCSNLLGLSKKYEQIAKKYPIFLVSDSSSGLKSSAIHFVEDKKKEVIAAWNIGQHIPTAIIVKNGNYMGTVHYSASEYGFPNQKTIVTNDQFVMAIEMALEQTNTK